MAHLKYKFTRLISLLKSGQFGEIRSRLLRIHGNSYPKWRKEMSRWLTNNMALINTNSEELVFSILMPVYKPNIRVLESAIESVKSQFYKNWQLCIADDGSNNPSLNKLLNQYVNSDHRIRFVTLPINQNISAASNAALDLATGSYIGFLDQDDILHPAALSFINKALKDKPSAKLIYTDEDKLDQLGRFVDPFFKPDWNPELFNAYNYLNHFVVVNRELITTLGGFKLGMEGAQDWDLLHRVIESINAEEIVHIPMVLYHWRKAKNSTASDISKKKYVQEKQRCILEDHLKRVKTPATISQLSNKNWQVIYLSPKSKPKASIVIPTRNQLMLLKKCINSITRNTNYSNYEILVIDNQSDDSKTLDYLSTLPNKNPLIKVVSYDAAFNFSAINNYAASLAEGEYLILINNDIEVTMQVWLDVLLGYAARPNAGAVGCMLYYPNDYIQHAGVVLGIGGVAANIYQGCYRGYPGHFLRAQLAQNLSAVTAACLAVEKRKFFQIGGFDEENLKVAFNDVDFCLRLEEAGYRNYWTPYVEMYHHESASRGYEDTPEKKARFISEVKYMQERWGKKLTNDPAYNPNLSLKKDDFSLAMPPRLEWLEEFWG